MIRATVLAAAFAAATAVLAGPASAQCEIDRPIVFAGLDYDSAAFHTAVARFVLEHGFGCRTETLPGTVIPLVNGVARGDVDVIMEIWTANPVQAWVEAEKAGKVVPLGTTFPDAVEGWYVTAPTVRGEGAPAPDLKSVADLGKYAMVFEDPEEPGKGRFYNCPAGWQCEVVNSKKLIAYGLADSYTNFRPGTGEALAAAADSAAIRGRPIVFYYWGPTWLLGKHDFVRLEEPAYDKKIWDEMMASDHPEQATAYPTSKVIIGANAEFVAGAPKLTQFLKAYSSTNAATSAALAYMREQDAKPDEAARHFLSTDTSWAQWVPAEVAEKVKAAL